MMTSSCFTFFLIRSSNIKKTNNGPKMYLCLLYGFTLPCTEIVNSLTLLFKNNHCHDSHRWIDVNCWIIFIKKDFIKEF